VFAVFSVDFILNDLSAETHQRKSASISG